MNKLYAALALAATLSPFQTAFAVDVHTGERVVIQVSDPDPKKWNLALNVAGNIRKELGADHVAVEVVVFGPAIDMLRDDGEIANRVGDSLKGGVQIAACANSMRNSKMTADQLVKDVTVVPAGVVEIMKRQREGWAYLRP
jgi:intracellular sulfur oxidation DsrE/DsrF family protein